MVSGAVADTGEFVEIDRAKHAEHDDEEHAEQQRCADRAVPLA